MLKYLFIALAMAVAAVGIWLYSLSGPKQLDFADRWYWGKADKHGRFLVGIPYGADKRQQVDIFQPEGNGPHPVLVFYHGGSWYHGEREGYAFLGRAFASRGYVTVIADYRKFPDVKFPAFVEDTADAIAWTYANIAKHGGDPDKIFLMGHSAGAHLSMLATLDPQWLARNNLDSSIVKGVIGLAGPFDFLPMEKGGAADKAMGDWPSENETQPITYARGDAPPLLLLQGGNDTLVGAHNSENLKAAVTKAGGRADYKLYKDVDHYEIIMAVARPFRDKASVIKDSVAFMQSTEKKLAAK